MCHGSGDIVFGPKYRPSGQSLEILNLVNNDIELLETNCFDDLAQLEVRSTGKNEEATNNWVKFCQSCKEENSLLAPLYMHNKRKTIAQSMFYVSFYRDCSWLLIPVPHSDRDTTSE